MGDTGRIAAQVAPLRKHLEVELATSDLSGRYRK